MAPTTRRARQGGFSFIEILVVLSIIAVLASMVVVAVPMIRERSKRTKSTDNVRSMLLLFTSAGVGIERKWPKFNGKDFVLWLVATNQISKNDAKALEVLFSPGDEDLAFPGQAPYKEFNLPQLGTSNQNNLKLTSYAGRRNAEKEHVLSAAAQQDNAMCICDDDEGSLHHKNGLICGYVGGGARFVEWSDLNMSPPDPTEPGNVLGDNSPNDELKHMSSGN
jgi:prepilin-type N-terminal cleavage/methylation domain-containing protein